MYAIELEVPISKETVVNVIPVCNSCKKRTWVSSQRMKPQSIHNHPGYLISLVNNAYISTSRQPTQAMTMERRTPIPCKLGDRSASHICAGAWSNDSIAQSLLVSQAPRSPITWTNAAESSQLQAQFRCMQGLVGFTD